MKNLLQFFTLLLTAYLLAPSNISAQNVGIGNTSPTAKLHVTGTGKFTGQLDMTNQDIVNVRELQVTAPGGKINLGGNNIENVNNFELEGALTAITGSTVNLTSTTLTLPALGNLNANNLTLATNGQLQMGGGSSAVNFSQVPAGSISFPNGMNIGTVTNLASSGTVSFATAASVTASNLNVQTTLNAGGNGFQVDNTGNTTTKDLNANGNITATGTCCSSDRRFKKNIQPLTGGLEKIMDLQGVEYDWRCEEFADRAFTDAHQIGFIAQDIEEIIPEMVLTQADGYKAVSYNKLAPVLVEAVKEQQAIIDAQREEINALKADMKAMGSAYTSLVERLDNLENNVRAESAQASE